jgi:hypothetical protein
MPNGKKSMDALSPADKQFIKRAFGEFLKPYATA